ncbi:MAG: DNRLRE domain-containing protein [Phycisphaerales bacterium]|nr:DNRLRE domain-containing protein [Phycisphaerales bacterium]
MVVALGAAAISWADVIVLQPVDDAFIINGGGGADSEILEQLGYYTTIKRPLLKFDLSSVPDAATVLSAFLTLQLNGIYGGQGHNTSVWRIPNDTWTEETVTWDSFDQTGAVAVALLPGTSEIHARVWNIRIADWTYADDLLDDAVTFMVRWDDSASEYESDGYYKWNTYSSKEGTSPPTLLIELDDCVLRGDLNADGRVDLGDLAVMLSHFGTLDGAIYAHGDLDGDGDVDLPDLAGLLSNFGTICP